MTTIQEHILYLNESKRILLSAIESNGEILDGVNLTELVAQIDSVLDDEYIDRGTVPLLSGNSEFDRLKLVRYLDGLTVTFDDIDFAIGEDTPDLMLSAGAGSLMNVYSPTQNRIYIIPQQTFTVYGVDNRPHINRNWFYINCDTGEVVAYEVDVAVPMAISSNTRGDGVFGAVYNPDNDRIYIFTSNNENEWYYINCKEDGKLFNRKTFLVEDSNVGGANYDYCPKNKCIYITQQFIVGFSTFDTETEKVSLFMQDGFRPDSQPHAVLQMFGFKDLFKPELMEIMSSVYHGATAYSPTQNRIYLSPAIMHSTIAGTFGNPEYFEVQPFSEYWHYIDCDTNKIVSYEHNRPIEEFTGNVYACADVVGMTPKHMGCVYSSKQNRIYLTPGTQLGSEVLHYIDCDTGEVCSYPNTIKWAMGMEYSGGAYSPITDRIYLTPFQIAHFDVKEMLPRLLAKHPMFLKDNPDFIDSFDNELIPKTHYIDCATNTIVEYCQKQEFAGMGNGVFSPTQNRIYFNNMFHPVAPFYIQEFSSIRANPKLGTM